MRHFRFLAIAASFVTACGDGNAPQNGVVARSTTPRIATPGFNCPPAGTSLTYTTGIQLNWTGTDLIDPDVCLLRINGPGARGERRRLYNYWDVNAPDLPALRAGAAAIYPLATGKTSRFTWEGRDADQFPVTVLENWAVLRSDNIDIGGQQRGVWVVQRASEFLESHRGNFKGVLTLWLDRETGVVLRQAVDVMRGTWPSQQSYQAISFQPGRPE